MKEQDVKKLKGRLRNEALEKFPEDKERQQAYIFGTLRTLGWKPKRKQ